MLGFRFASTWCAGCETYVRDSRWNQDTYLCHDCSTLALRLLRRWASGKTLTAFPISTVLRHHVEA